MENKKNILKLLIAFLVLSLGLNMFLGYKAYLNTKVEEGVKEKITIKVVVDTPSQEKMENTYVLVGSEVEFLKPAMDELGIEYVASDAGFVSTIDGVTAVWDETQNRQEYWSILINGEYGQEGISTQVVKDGDVITFQFVDVNAENQEGDN